MKNVKKLTLGLALLALTTLFSGCDVNGDSIAKKGTSCEKKDAVAILKRIVDRKFNGDYEIESDNIIVWDYNPVGRYTCKAKIKKVAEAKKKSTDKDKDPDAAMIAVMAELLAPAQFGISKEGGWVNYYTYETTKHSLYVEIFTDEDAQ